MLKFTNYLVREKKIFIQFKEDVMCICANCLKDAKTDPVIHATYLRSGSAISSIYCFEYVIAVIPFSMRSQILLNNELPPARTMFLNKFRTFGLYLIMTLYVVLWMPSNSNQIRLKNMFLAAEALCIDINHFFFSSYWVN